MNNPPTHQPFCEANNFDELFPTFEHLYDSVADAADVSDAFSPSSYSPASAQFRQTGQDGTSGSPTISREGRTSSLFA